ncbi:reverse transcriptase domain-containing protein [Tanacetum coccineum]
MNMLTNLTIQRQSPSGSRSLPSDTVAKAITTQSGVAYEGPSILPTSFSLPKKVEREPEVTKDKVQPTNLGSTAHFQPPVVQVPISEPDVAPKPNPKPSIPYPSRLNDQKLRENANNQMLKFLHIFQKLHFDLSFADVLLHMPKFASAFKSLLSNKEKLFELANTPLNENCSSVLLKKLPEKLGDPGKFLIPCDFSELVECLALADLGVSINLMPLSVWKKLSLPKLTPTRMTLELANRSVDYPVGVAEDVFVKVRKFHFSADFVVVDNDVDPRVPLILGRPFLRTARALIDVYGEELTLRFNDEAITFIVGHTSRYSYRHDYESFNEWQSTPSDPIIASSSPSFTPFEGGDFILEVIETFLHTPDTLSNLNDDYYDTKGDILYLEKLLNEDPSPNLPPMKNKDLKQVDVTMTKPSIEEPLELELKDLPPYLEYAYLKGTDKLPVIISKDVKDDEKARLLKLNDATRKDHFPLPFMDQMLECLAGNEYYCFLDGFSRYFQISIDPQDQEKTTFTCPYGTFAHRRMPFGLCNAPGTFQRCMMAIFHDMIEETMEATNDKVQTTAHVQPLVVQVPIPEPDVAPKPNPKLLIPYPSRLNDKKLQEKANNQMLKFLQIFQRLHFDLSFADALLHMPKFASMFQSLLSNKEKLFELANTSLNENCSAVLLKKLPKKLGDPGRFLIPCDFPELDKCLALADLDVSINLMPLSVWKKLSLSELTPTHITLELANRSVAYPVGVTEDVIVKVERRPFLRTARALVDVHGEELILRDSNEKLIFHVDSTSKHPHNHGKESISMINFIDITREDRFPEVLKLKKSNHLSSGSTTPHYDYSVPDYDTFYFDDDHIEEKSSGSTTTHSDFSLPEYDSFIFDLSIDPFPPADRSTFYHEEFADELAFLDPFPLGNEDDNFNPEADLKKIEYLLNRDPSTKSSPKYDIEIIDPILGRFTNEPALVYSLPPGEDNDEDDDLFDLKFDNDEWKKFLYGDSYKDIDRKNSLLALDEPFLLDTPPPGSKLVSLEEVENFDPSLSLNRLEMMTRMADIPSLKLNEDECFDPGGGEIDTDIPSNFDDIIYLESLLNNDTIPNIPPEVFLDHDPKSLNDEPSIDDLKIKENVRLPFEDRYYLSLTFVIKIFLPFLTYLVNSLPLLSSGSEDLILTQASSFIVSIS